MGWRGAYPAQSVEVAAELADEVRWMVRVIGGYEVEALCRGIVPGPEAGIWGRHLGELWHAIDVDGGC